MKIFLALILIIWGTPVLAQRGVNQNLKGFDENNKIHFGVLIGLNQLNSNLSLNNTIFKEDTIYSLNLKSSPGFNIGMITDFHLGKKWDLRIIPSLILGERIFEYLIADNDNIFKESRLSESYYLSLPVEFKYKSERYGNWRSYLTGGGFLARDMVSNKNMQQSLTAIKLQKLDYGYTIGFGLEFFLEYFKFSPQFKWDKGLRNMIIKDKTPFTSIIDNIRSRTFTISFTFEG